MSAWRDLRGRAARRGRLLRRRLTGDAGAYVLLYHRVADTARDPWGLAVRPERFAQQLAVLCEHARPLPLAEFARARAAGALPRNAVAVTFDDGYADNLHAAKPLLAAHGVPATVFLATGYAGRGLPFWWDEVQRLVLGAHALPAALRLGHGLTTAPFERTSAAGAAREPLFHDLWAWFSALDRDARHVALAQLRESIDVPATPDDPRAMTAAEVRALVEGGIVDVGAHTVSHPVLTALPADRQRDEIVRSKSDAEALVGRPVSAFSYPHGRYDAHTARIVREAGFTAVGTSASGDGPHDAARAADDPLHIPRVSVLDWDADTFRRKLLAGFEV